MSTDKYYCDECNYSWYAKSNHCPECGSSRVYPYNVTRLKTPIINSSDPGWSDVDHYEGDFFFNPHLTDRGD